MNSIRLFGSKQIRSVWNEVDRKWYFSVSDVVEVLTDSANVKDFIKKMRKREQALDAIWGTICPPLKLIGGAASVESNRTRADDGKRLTRTKDKGNGR